MVEAAATRRLVGTGAVLVTAAILAWGGRWGASTSEASVTAAGGPSPTPPAGVIEAPLSTSAVLGSEPVLAVVGPRPAPVPAAIDAPAPPSATAPGPTAAEVRPLPAVPAPPSVVSAPAAAAPVPPSTTSTTSTTSSPVPATEAPAVGEWRAMRTNDDGSPVRYDPCRAIPYVTRLDGGPAFARAELDWAIGQLEAASGLDLQWVGDVSEPMSDAWPTDGPLHLGFATEAEFAMPAGVSGYGDSWTVTGADGRRWYSGGRVVLRPDHGWTQGVTSANPLGLMFLHELGHVVGLAHVRSSDEVMTDQGNGTARQLGPGDRAGLAAVGRSAGCR